MLNNANPNAAKPDYMLIGHVAHDETPKGSKLGGTVSYAGSAADAIGARVAIVTSAHPADPVLPALPKRAQLHLIPATQSTIFVNTYVGDTRRQEIKGRANLLGFADIPEAWRETPVVHLGPLDDEVDPELARAFPHSLVGATPQGWMRAWDEHGVVRAKPWGAAEWLLPILGAAVFSEEDIGRDAALEAHYAALANLLVVTRAANGCTVYQRYQPPMDVPAPAVNVVDATGAGDVFAGIFLTMLHRTQNVRRAAEIATRLASISVTRVGLGGTPTPDEVRAALDAHS